MPVWLLFSLGFAIFGGIGQVVAKKGFEQISALWNNIFSEIFGIFIWIPIALIGVHFHLIVPQWYYLVLIFLTGVCYLSYFYVISKGNIALTGTLFETYSIFTAILSFLLLGERITIFQLFGILITISGVMFIIWPSRNQIRHISSYTWVMWGVMGAVMEGIGDFFAKITVNAVGAFTQMFYLVVTFAFTIVFNILLDKKGRKLPKLSLPVLLPTLIGTGCIVLAQALLFFAFQYGKASLATPVSTSSPVIVVILASVFLKEKITRRQLLGIGIVVLGIGFVGFGA